jgi:hypothetical protein
VSCSWIFSTLFTVLTKIRSTLYSHFIYATHCNEETVYRRREAVNSRLRELSMQSISRICLGFKGPEPQSYFTNLTAKATSTVRGKIWDPVLSNTSR